MAADRLQTPEIGDELVATAAEPIGHGRWRAEIDNLPEGWSAEIHFREESKSPPTEPTTYWVFNVDPKRGLAFLSDSDFGRLPISNRMRPRYVKALSDVLNTLTAEAEPLSAPEELLSSVSEVKGMLSRCLKKDQWDWLSIYEGLGRPTHKWMRRVVNLLTRFRRSLQERDKEALLVLRRDLLELRAADRFVAVRTAVLEGTPRLSKARTLRDKDISGYAPRRHKNPTSAPELTQQKLETANVEHQKTLAVLAEYLIEYGYRVEENKHIDAFCRLRSGPAIFEVKSVTSENELSQCRHALSQLYEYRFRHDLKEASLWLVLSREPQTEPWLVKYLREDRDIRVLWTEGERLVGPDLPLLTESGSAAMRRDFGEG